MRLAFESPRDPVAYKITKRIDRFIGDAIKDAGAAALPGDESVRHEQGQVAGYIGRRVAAQLRQFAHAAFTLTQQIEYLQACWLGQRLEIRGDLFESLRRESFHSCASLLCGERHSAQVTTLVFANVRRCIIDYVVKRVHNTRNYGPWVGLRAIMSHRAFNAKKFMRNNWVIRLAGAVLVLVPLGEASAVAAELATAAVTSSKAPERVSVDGVVEAVKQSIVAAQVSGTVTQLQVKAGDQVHAGQVLVLLDARVAEQGAAASDAQVQAERASLEVASQEYDRQRQLYEKNYISQAAFERAQAQFRAKQAQVSAQLAQAGAARTQTGFFVVRAPYAGIVAEVPVALGDMALPGRPLISLYDASALRVTAAVPQSALKDFAQGQGAKVELPGLPAQRQWYLPVHVQVLPTEDSATHTVQVRLDLVRGVRGIFPGMFARVWFPVQGSLVDQRAGTSPLPRPERLFVPVQAVVHRSEVTALYVVADGGRPVLRQVRLGERLNESVEILSGVSAGESVALDPQAAARVR